jgi:hypothetical protein
MIRKLLARLADKLLREGDNARLLMLHRDKYESQQAQHGAPAEPQYGAPVELTTEIQLQASLPGARSHLTRSTGSASVSTATSHATRRPASLRRRETRDLDEVVD